MLFLEDFWKGDATPGEKRFRPNSEYSNVFQTLERCEDYLKTHLEGEALRVFEEYAKAELDISCLSDCDNYIEGFRTGAKMMMDVLLAPSVCKIEP